MGNVIEVSGLRKFFGRTRALDGLDLSVSPGEVHGFLGPNGAGKTTTIRILLGLLRADGGTARLLDGDPWREATALHRRLAYVPGDVTLWPNLSGGEIIDLLGRLHGGINPKRRAELLERFDLDPAKKARAYSKGNRQKVALVAALACDAELLILDERRRWPGCRRPPWPWPSRGWPDSAAATSARQALKEVSGRRQPVMGGSSCARSASRRTWRSGRPGSAGVSRPGSGTGSRTGSRCSAWRRTPSPPG
jgi:ABC-type transport system involved in cytochrome c biogenesis ATPase subunit